MSFVSQQIAEPSEVFAHYSLRLSLETDCADVHHAFATDTVDFVLLHAVGSKEAFAAKHIPGAVHLPHREISEANLSRWPQGTLFVVYCAGPHCNGADQAAMKISRLGRRVKVMIGGLTGWADEGFEFAQTAQETERA